MAVGAGVDSWGVGGTDGGRVVENSIFSLSCTESIVVATAKVDPMAGSNASGVGRVVGAVVGVALGGRII
jgi:hypothetical protein